ncbi:MAG: hypothetical protein GXY33_04640 [Phycisphaerae bacterium]|nr:hypothetical protein [Phycisphaerae bacterium]
MSKDIGSILRSWPSSDEGVDARVVVGTDGQPQLQLRLDCGLLQMVIDGRPDATKPHNCQTYLEYVTRRVAEVKAEDPSRGVPRKAWAELDREMTQFYHRRVGMLAVARRAQDGGESSTAASYYERAVRDADYTLEAMDFIRDHCDDEDHVENHERYRPFVLWHRTIALTQRRVLDKDFDEAVEQIKSGMGQIAKVYEDHGLTKWLRHDPSIAELRMLERQIRRQYGVKQTLSEQLEVAIAAEDYENAARIRDQLKAKGRFRSPRGAASARF